MRPPRCSVLKVVVSVFLMLATCLKFPGRSAVPPVIFTNVLNIITAKVQVLASYMMGVSCVYAFIVVVCLKPRGRPLEPGGATNSRRVLDWALKCTSSM